MPELFAKSALAGQTPLVLGNATLAEATLPQITSLAPLRGREKALAQGLKAMGLAFPAPNGMAAKGAARILWTGRDQAFLIGADPAPLAGLAAITDQSDGWCGLTLTGADAPEVHARLVPLDLRATAFPPGRVARAPLNHMQMILLREADGFLLLVFRSMARSAWHEIAAAMSAVAARAAC